MPQGRGQFRAGCVGLTRYKDKQDPHQRGRERGADLLGLVRVAWRRYTVELTPDAVFGIATGRNMGR